MTSYNNQTHNDIEALRSKLKGTVMLPEDAGYTSASQPWNLYIKQRPSLVVVARSPEDVQVALRFAGDKNLGVGVMATGHGVGKPCNGGLLINTSQMRGVSIDPSSRTAEVEAGALWKDVIPEAHSHGLATLAGSAPHVGVVGYTMGGGFGFLGRKFGLNSSSIISANVVTSNGELLKVSNEENEDLFWGLKGGGGNFGIVTSLKFKLYPITTVFGGAVFYPLERGHEALTLFAQWAKQIPDEVTAALAFMNVPPLPSAPEILRGRSVVAIKGCYCGDNPEQGRQLFASLRALSSPIADTFGLMLVTNMDAISKDPVDPLGHLQYSSLITDLSKEAIDAFVKVAGAESGSSLLMAEFRKLGGALAPNTGDIKLMGNRNAQFSLNALGATATQVMAAKVESHLSSLSEAMRPYQSNEVFLNFVEANPGPARVRMAYDEEDWKRLVALKAKYDPRNILHFNRNIAAG